MEISRIVAYLRKELHAPGVTRSRQDAVLKALLIICEIHGPM